MEGDMMRYYYHLHKDYHGIPAEDKERIYDLITDGPKTTKQMASITGMDTMHIRDVVFCLESAGIVHKVGRHQRAIIWGCKA